MAAQPNIELPDGVALHLESWEPQGEPTCVVVISHGQGEHASRYDRVASDFGAFGALCFAPDHRGQGRSGGKRGHIDSFDTYARDLRHVIEVQRAALPAALQPEVVPWFLFCHSMGGLIGLTYLIDHVDAVPLRGAVISNPLLGLAFEPNPFMLMLGKVAAVVMPGASVPEKLDAATICRDPEEVERYRNDPIRVPNVTFRWFAQMQKAIAKVQANVASIELPLLWYAGTGDLICDHTKSVEAFERLPAPEPHDQTLKLFDGYYHECHNEPEEYRQPAMAIIGGWIEDRLKPRGS